MWGPTSHIADRTSQIPLVPPSAWPRRAALLAVAVALFSAFYTAGELLGVWPAAAPAAFPDLDLIVGAAGVAALAAALLLSRRASG